MSARSRAVTREWVGSDRRRVASSCAPLSAGRSEGRKRAAKGGKVGKRAGVARGKPEAPSGAEERVA